jgi:hypothetical protein
MEAKIRPGKPAVNAALKKNTSLRTAEIGWGEGSCFDSATISALTTRLIRGKVTFSTSKNVHRFLKGYCH